LLLCAGGKDSWCAAIQSQRRHEWQQAARVDGVIETRNPNEQQGCAFATQHSTQLRRPCRQLNSSVLMSVGVDHKAATAGRR